MIVFASRKLSAAPHTNPNTIHARLEVMSMNRSPTPRVIGAITRYFMTPRSGAKTIDSPARSLFLYL